MFENIGKESVQERDKAIDSWYGYKNIEATIFRKIDSVFAKMCWNAILDIVVVAKCKCIAMQMYEHLLNFL